VSFRFLAHPYVSRSLQSTASASSINLFELEYDDSETNGAIVELRRRATATLFRK
jgi:hypothetical protein